MHRACCVILPCLKLCPFQRPSSSVTSHEKISLLSFPPLGPHSTVFEPLLWHLPCCMVRSLLTCPSLSLSQPPLEEGPSLGRTLVPGWGWVDREDWECEGVWRVGSGVSSVLESDFGTKQTWFKSRLCHLPAMGLRKVA